MKRPALDDDWLTTLAELHAERRIPLRYLWSGLVGMDQKISLTVVHEPHAPS
jgi:hypothetical protein